MLSFIEAGQRGAGTFPDFVDLDKRKCDRRLCTFSGSDTESAEQGCGMTEAIVETAYPGHSFVLPLGRGGPAHVAPLPLVWP